MGGFACQSYVEVEPPCLCLRVVVDSVALPSSAGNSRAALYLSRPFVVCELTGVVDRDKDFLAVMVSMESDAATRGDHSSVNKSEWRAGRKRG